MCLLLAQRTAVIQPHQIANRAGVELIMCPKLGSALDLLIDLRMSENARDLHHDLCARREPNMPESDQTTGGAGRRPRASHRLVVCSRGDLADKLAERVADVGQNLRHPSSHVHPRRWNERSGARREEPSPETRWVGCSVTFCSQASWRLTKLS